MISLVFLGRLSKKDIVSLQQIFNRMPLLKYRYRDLFRFGHVPTNNDDIFALINQQTSNLQPGHWIMTANSRHIIYFEQFFGRKNYSLLKQLCEQMMPSHLLSHPSVRGICSTFAAFHHFKFRERDCIGVQEFNVPSFSSNFLIFQKVSMWNLQSFRFICENFYSLFHALKLQSRCLHRIRHKFFSSFGKTSTRIIKGCSRLNFPQAQNVVDRASKNFSLQSPRLKSH